jgi:hypothetical protein
MTFTVAVAVFLFDREGFKDINWVQCVAMDVMCLATAWAISFN